LIPPKDQCVLILRVEAARAEIAILV
jgi:hypothetical protein